MPDMQRREKSEGGVAVCLTGGLAFSFPREQPSPVIEIDGIGFSAPERQQGCNPLEALLPGSANQGRSYPPGSDSHQRTRQCLRKSGRNPRVPAAFFDRFFSQPCRSGRHGAHTRDRILPACAQSLIFSGQHTDRSLVDVPLWTISWCLAGIARRGGEPTGRGGQGTSLRASPARPHCRSGFSGCPSGRGKR